MRSVSVLAAAIGGSALVLWLAPMLAEQMLPWLGAPQGNSAALETWFTLLIFGPLLAIALTGGRWCRLNPLRLGQNRAFMLTVGSAIGAFGILAAAGLARMAGSLAPGEADAEWSLLLWGSLVILFAAATEEVYFRGWLQPELARNLGVPAAILLSALAFAALHLIGGARGPVTLVNLVLGGLLFGLLAAQGGGLAGAVAAHFAWNWTEQIALGLDPNPGIGSFGALTDLDLAGPAIWGGSDEGLNASLGMTLALVALLVPMTILARASLARPPERVSKPLPK